MENGGTRCTHVAFRYSTGHRRACKFTWRGIAARAMLVKRVYQKGIKLFGKEKKNLEKRLTRSSSLRWWDICIKPKPVFYNKGILYWSPGALTCDFFRFVSRPLYDYQLTIHNNYITSSTHAGSWSLPSPPCLVRLSIHPF